MGPFVNGGTARSRTLCFLQYSLPTTTGPPLNAESAVFALFADLVLVLHGTFVFFVVGGQILILLAWWRRWQWAHHLVTTTHTTDRRLDHGAAGIFKTSPGFQIRLFPDDALTAHLLNFVIGVCDDSVA